MNLGRKKSDIRVIFATFRVFPKRFINLQLLMTVICKLIFNCLIPQKVQIMVFLEKRIEPILFLVKKGACEI